MLEIDQSILAAINAEREFAHEKYGNKLRPVGEHLLLIERYVYDAKHKWNTCRGDNAALHELRKLAAMTIQCLTEHGCPFRGEPVLNGNGQQELLEVK